VIAVIGSGAVGLYLVWVLLIEWWWLEVDLQTSDGSWTMQCTLHVPGIFHRRRWQVPSTTHGATPSLAFTARRIQGALLIFRRFRHVATGLRRRLVVDRFDASLQVGLGNAQLTAMVVGWADWLVGWWIHAEVGSRAAVPPQWTVTPDWNRQGIHAHLTCRIKIKGWMLLGPATQSGLLEIEQKFAIARRQVLWQKLQRTFTRRGNIRSKG